MRGQNIIGTVFGKLSVVNKSHIDNHGNTFFLCNCVCGETKTVRRDHLIRGKIGSCGCLVSGAKPGDLVGNGIVVVKTCDKKNMDSKFFWTFRCFCGNEFKSIPDRIKKYRTTSCGCFQQGMANAKSKNKILGLTVFKSGDNALYYGRRFAHGQEERAA